VRALTLEHLQILAHPDTGALPYHDPRITALIWELKYQANKRALTLAGEFLSEQLIALAAEELGKPLLIPIPMHRNRRRTRGHNQTELLCRAALLHAGEFLEYTPQALARIVDTPPQQGLERGKRLKNVEHSMEALEESVRGRVCIVLDDVTTTGATLEEARRALGLAGARRVHLVALAQS
jgi:ComF family protein